MKYNLQGLKNFSFASDLKLMVQTVAAVASSKGKKPSARKLPGRQVNALNEEQRAQ